MLNHYYLQFEDETNQDALDAGGFLTIEDAEAAGYSLEPKKAFLVFHIQVVMDRIEDRDRIVDFLGYGV